MSFQATSGQALLIWRMMFVPGMEEVGTKTAPNKLRAPLVREGILEGYVGKNEKGNRAQRFRLTDHAWAWGEANLDTKLNPAPSAGPVLAAVLARVKTLLAAHGLPLAELVREQDTAHEQADSHSHAQHDSNGQHATHDTNGQHPAKNAAIGNGSSASEPAPAQIRRAYLAHTRGQFNESLSLEVLRRSLPELPRESFDAALLQLFRTQAVVLFPEDNTRQLTAAMQHSAFELSGEPKHYLKLER